MNWKHHRAFAITFALALTLSLATPAVGGVAAQDSGEDDGVLSQLFGILPDIPAFARGVLDRVNPLADEPASEADAETYAERVETTINQNNQTLIDWTNSRADVTTDYDVIRIKFTDADGGSEYLFITSTVNTTTEDITSATAMNLSEFKDTNRDVDRTYRLGPDASRNANQELETFISDYAEPDEDVTGEYTGRLAGRYVGQVHGPDIPTGWL